MDQFYNPFPFVDGMLLHVSGCGKFNKHQFEYKEEKEVALLRKLHSLNQVTLLFFPTYLYKHPNISYNIPLGTVDVLYLKRNRSLLSLTKLPKYQFSKQLQFRRGTTESIFSSSRRKQVFAFLFIVKPSDENNCKIIYVSLCSVAYTFFMKKIEILSENGSNYSNLLSIISQSITSNM